MSMWNNLRHLETRNLNVALSQREIHSVNGDLASTIFRQRLSTAQNLYQRNLIGHYGCVNALEFSQGGQFLASGGDDKRVLLWNIDREVVSELGNPRSMNEKHASNIFCLGFDAHNSYVVSGGNDDLVIQHDLVSGKILNCFSHDGPVYGLSVDKTSSSIFSVATEHGEVLVYDLRVGHSDYLTIAKFRSPFNAVEFHPLNGNFMATANAKRGAMLWDLRRNQQALCQFNCIPESPSCMSVRFNCNGTGLLTLHRRLPPILFNPGSPEPVATFYHEEYFNSCTMKSCTFAGPQDEMIVSGSDNFNMFVWRVDGVDLEERNQWVDTPPMILAGHRSIVNQVRYNRQRCLLASSGVEKIIKLWSPFAQRDWEGSLSLGDTAPYCTRTLHRTSSAHVLQDFSAGSTEEDQIMLAFFDSLVQRELESWDKVNNDTGATASGSSTSTSMTSSTSSTSSLEDTSILGIFVSADESLDREEGEELEEQEDLLGFPAAGGEQNGQDPDSDYDDTGRDSPNASEHSSHLYPNRIFYLIAKKRKALLQLAVSSTTGQAVTQARVSDWLKETSQVFKDEDQPSTSAEAAAREQRRRNGDSRATEAKTGERFNKCYCKYSPTMVFSQKKLNRGGMGWKETTVSTRRTKYPPLPRIRNGSAMAILNDDPLRHRSSSRRLNPSSVELDSDDSSSSATASMTSMEAQVSQASSNFGSYPEANNNSQLTSNHNHNHSHKTATATATGLVPDGCNTESTASTSSSI
ncbi:hypothetical protein KR018_011365 [Drosophila ironensis]|nr:hypothetical protein KR018_011365 [Drosophila ironensis]